MKENERKDLLKISSNGRLGKYKSMMILRFEVILHTHKKYFKLLMIVEHKYFCACLIK